MLTINRVTYGDAGQYTCSDKNSEGKNDAAFHIKVTGKCWLIYFRYIALLIFCCSFWTFTFLNWTCYFYAQVLLKSTLSSGISRLHIIHRFNSNALKTASLHLRYSGLKTGWILVTTTLSQLIEWVMEMLVNTHAELTTVKGKGNQLFILQSQVNVDLILFSSVALLTFWGFFFFSYFHLFELYFWILCPGPPEINPELKNQSVTYKSPLQFRCSLSGFPIPEILWTKDGVNLGNNNTFTINRVTYGDAAQYKCSANNSEGKSESAFHIIVTGKYWLTFVSLSFYSHFLIFLFILSPCF